MANFNFNKVMLGGRLTAEPEQMVTQDGTSVCRVGIAVNRRGGKGADFFSIVAFEQVADLITRYFRKGSSICVVGVLRQNVWTDKQGVKRSQVEVVVGEVYFVDSRAEGDVVKIDPSSPAARELPPEGKPYGETERSFFELYEGDTDAPF